MGHWYAIGILVGVGVALGVASGGALRRALARARRRGRRRGSAWASRSPHWEAAAGGIVGAVCGTFGSAPLVAGTLRRGGTRGGTATLLALAALLGAALAFVPVLGYLEAVAVPLLGVRLRRRAVDRHAGLRTLAK